jgi:hypothetical protein
MWGLVHFRVEQKTAFLLSFPKNLETRDVGSIPDSFSGCPDSQCVTDYRPLNNFLGPNRKSNKPSACVQNEKSVQSLRGAPRQKPKEEWF